MSENIQDLEYVAKAYLESALTPENRQYLADLKALYKEIGDIMTKMDDMDDKWPNPTVFSATWSNLGAARGALRQEMANLVVHIEVLAKELFLGDLNNG